MHTKQPPHQHQKAFASGVKKLVWSDKRFKQQTATRAAMVSTGAYGVGAGAVLASMQASGKSPLSPKMGYGYAAASTAYGAGMLYGAHKKFSKKK